MNDEIPKQSNNDQNQQSHGEEDRKINEQFLDVHWSASLTNPDWRSAED
jgi:hypothetical protein